MGTATSWTCQVHTAPKQPDTSISIQPVTGVNVPAGLQNEIVHSSQVIGPHDADDDSQTVNQSSWICQVHAALEKNNIDDSQALIWKVPPLYRTNAEHYEPLSWRFGLHHCPPVLHTNGTEGFKIEVARALQLKGEQWDNFCKAVVQEPKKYWEATYAESAQACSYTIEEIRCLLSLDALVLVVYLQWYGGGIKSLHPALQKVMKSPILQPYFVTLRHDYWLVENQIPMELMKRVVGVLRRDHTDILPPWDHADWQGRNIGMCVPWYLFNDPRIGQVQENNLFDKRMVIQLQHANYYSRYHILDSIYGILCGWESAETPHEKFIQTIPSASYLESCGVTIKSKEFTSFEDISFENGCLSVLYLSVYDETEKWLRNLVVHEALTRPDQGSVSQYTLLMDYLMKTPDDVHVLVKRGVMLANVGSYENVVDMWKRINYNIEGPKVSEKFYTMLMDVTKYASSSSNKYRFEFKKQFCSRPWIILSVLAITFVTIAAGIQTYVAVISSNRMKPTFHH